MTGSILKLSEVKKALQREKLNFKILNNTADSVIFLDELTKAKLRGKIVRSFNEGEVYHWPLLNHENIDRLIDILCVRDDLYIYLTIDHDITLKNIVHDEDFIYEPRCFDRKRLYAKGIFSGLSYLHEKSLSLMNLCDDNIIISRVDDRAIITNFDHLICERKSRRSRLNVPEMYMAPETEEGEFDSMKAEIWASGMLMLDMFLAHMIPWADAGHKPKKVLKIVDNLTLDLLQAANVGSVVTTLDLMRFKSFLKRFFRKNPQERIPVKYAYIASFLQYRAQIKVHRNSHQSVSFPEVDLSLDFYNLNLSTCYNPTYNPSSNLIMQKTQKREAETIEIAPHVLTNETQQDERLVQFPKNKTKFDISNAGSLKNNINQEKQENSTKTTLLPSYKTVASIANVETIDDFQKISKSWEENEVIKAENESCYNGYQSKSLTIIKLKSDDNTNEFENISNKNFCYSNNKASPEKQSVEYDLPSDDIGLNLLFDNTYGDDCKNYPVDMKDGDISAVKSGSEKTETSKRISEIVKTEHLQNKTQIMQRFPSEHGCNGSVQTLENRIIKQPRTFKAPHIFLSPEIKSVINKIAFLRRCYVSIQAHQKVFISYEFASKQIKFIKEYKNFLYLEDFRLREKLMTKYKLKFEDVKKLINYVNLGILSRRCQYETSVNRHIFYDTKSNFQQTRRMEDGTENFVERLSTDKVKDTNDFILRPDRNHSYHKAIEYSENDHDRKWVMNSQADKQLQKVSERFDFEPDSKMKRGFRFTTDYNKLTKEENLDIKEKEMVKEYEKVRKCVKTVDEKQCNTGECPKKTQDKNSTKKDKRDNKTKVETAKSPKMPDNNKSNKKKKVKPINQKRVKETAEMKSNCNKNMKKKEKNLHQFKKVKEPKNSWFFSLCPGGKIEDPTSTLDTLCETCKLNLEFS